MKNQIKKVSILVTLVIALSLNTPQLLPFVSTNNIVNTVEASSKTKISKKKLTLFVKKSYTLSINNNKKKVKWASSDDTIATVSSKGKVKAKDTGSVVITATVGKITYECKVKVENPYISDQNPKITVGDKKQLFVNGTIQKVKWSSSNKKIATVNSKGLIKAKKAGKAVITAVVNGKSLKATVKVTKKSKEVEITSFKILDKEQLEANTFLFDDDENPLTFYCQVLPATADVEIVWSISDTSKLWNTQSETEKRVLIRYSGNGTIPYSSTKPEYYKSYMITELGGEGTATVTASVKGHPEISDSVEVKVAERKHNY